MCCGTVYIKAPARPRTRWAIVKVDLLLSAQSDDVSRGAEAFHPKTKRMLAWRGLKDPVGAQTERLGGGDGGGDIRGE